MKIKRFVTADMRQAIRRVRDELGPNAVILSNRRTEDGVEVTAAIDYEPNEAAGRAWVDAAPAPPATGRSARSGATDPGSSGAAARATAPGGPAPGAASGEAAALARMREELSCLRGMIEDQLGRLAWSELERREPLRTAAIRHLRDLGLAPEAAERTADRLGPGLAPEEVPGRAREALAERIAVCEYDLLERGGVAALIGPTGVGKTTTVAKLAARFAIRHGPQAVALVTTDSYRVGAHEQLRTFARIIDIPVMVATGIEDLRLALEQFCDRRLVLVDTAGASPRDVRFSEQIAMVSGGSPGVRNYLVASATSDYLGLCQALTAFAGAGVDGCVVTKIDEATSLGPVLSLLAESAIPLAYASAGQRVPEDLMPGRARGLVQLAVELAEESRRSAPPARRRAEGVHRA